MRTNGSINIVETDLTGNQRVAFNLRDIGEKDALKISIAREMFDLLKDIDNADLFEFTMSLTTNRKIIEIKSRMNELLKTENQKIE